MDQMKIIKRAFYMTWNYRALWLFGALVALTGARSGGNGGSGGSGSTSSYNFPAPEGFPDFSLPHIGAEAIAGLIAGGVILVCLFFVLGIVGIFLRYVAQTALMRMVSQHEASGEKIGIRQGFRLGWSRQALRIFGIDLVFGLGGFVIFMLLMLIGATPLLVWLVDNTPLRVLGTIVSIGLLVLFLFVAILAGLALSVLMQFFYRAAALEDLGLGDALRRGWRLCTRRLSDVVVMAVILLALGLGWFIVMIPVTLMVLAAAVLIGGMPALLVGSVTGIFTQGALPWVLAAIVGAPLFLLVMIAPLVFLQGLAEVFTSTTWTLVYRELIMLVEEKREEEEREISEKREEREMSETHEDTAQGEDAGEN